MRKHELIKMLSDVPDDARIVIAGCPDKVGWVNDILPFYGRCNTGEVVIGPREDTIYTEESDIIWPKRPT